MSESLPIECRILQAIAARVATIRTASGAAVDIGRRVTIGMPADPFRDPPCAIVNIVGESGVTASDPVTKPHRTLRVTVAGIGPNVADPLPVGIRIGDDIERAVMAGEVDEFSPATRRLNGLVSRIAVDGATYSPSDQQGIARAYAEVAFSVAYLKSFGGPS